ncbi:MAG: hypothetical protein KKH98_13980, partial [Spirochaetes bacterium]|nr:hypothetical protein [Spirochaetota bacterium]
MTKKKKRNKPEQVQVMTPKPPKLLDSKQESKIFNIVSLLFIFLGFLLLYNQFVTIEKLFNKVAAFTNWGTLGQFMAFLDKYSSQIFTSTDNLIGWLIGITFSFLVLMEISKSWLSLFFERLFQKKRNVLIFLFAFFFIMLRFYIAKGEDMAYGDGPFHLAHIWYGFKGFQAGKIFPYWTTIFSCGSLVIWPYSPMYPLLYGFIAFITGNFFFGLKLAFLLAQLAGAIGIYLWLREYTEDKRAAMIGSIGYGLSFEFVVVMLFPGRYPAGLLVGIVPFIFYLSERLIKDFANIKLLIIMAILIAVVPLVHFAMGLWMLIFWAIYITLRIFLLKDKFKKNLKKYSLIITAVLVSILLTLFFIIPTLNGFDGWNWIGKRFLITYGEGGQFASEPAPDFSKILFWNNGHFSLFGNVKGTWDIGYIGFTVFLLSLIGIYYIFKKKQFKYLPLAVIYLLNFYILIFYHAKLSSLIPFLKINGPSRYLIYFILPTASLSSVAFLFLIKKIKINPVKIFSIIFLILLLDMGTTTFQDTYALKYRPQSVGLFQWMKTNFPETPSYRVISLGTRN